MNPSWTGPWWALRLTEIPFTPHRYLWLMSPRLDLYKLWNVNLTFVTFLTFVLKKKNRVSSRSTVSACRNLILAPLSGPDANPVHTSGHDTTAGSYGMCWFPCHFPSAYNDR